MDLNAFIWKKAKYKRTFGDAVNIHTRERPGSPRNIYYKVYVEDVCRLYCSTPISSYFPVKSQNLPSCSKNRNQPPWRLCNQYFCGDKAKVFFTIISRPSAIDGAEFSEVLPNGVRRDESIQSNELCSASWNLLFLMFELTNSAAFGREPENRRRHKHRGRKHKHWLKLPHWQLLRT